MGNILVQFPRFSRIAKDARRKQMAHTTLHHSRASSRRSRLGQRMKGKMTRAMKVSNTLRSPGMVDM
jgi:hypothetical protein